MKMARNWREIRADAIVQGRLDPARVDVARKEMHDAVQAQRLADPEWPRGRIQARVELAYRGVRAAAQLFGGQLGEPALNQVQPGRAGRGEMQR